MASLHIWCERSQRSFWTSTTHYEISRAPTMESWDRKCWSILDLNKATWSQIPSPPFLPTPHNLQVNHQLTIRGISAVSVFLTLSLRGSGIPSTYILWVAKLLLTCESERHLRIYENSKNTKTKQWINYHQTSYPCSSFKNELTFCVQYNEGYFWTLKDKFLLLG